jgi:acetyl esterase
MDADTMRAASRERMLARPRGPELHRVRDIAAGEAIGVAMRLYRPAAEARPLVVHLHGGGWVMGDLDTHDRTCRRLAARADVAVLAVDVRRAPEHSWPAAVDDAVNAIRFATANWADLGADGRAVGVTGDSSGGTLATLACLRLRGSVDLPRAQLLAYPNTDLTLSQPSVRTKGAGFGLEADTLRWFVAQWVPDPALRARGDVSPLFAPHLEGMPATLVVTAEHDPLRDEGDAYARRLHQAGVTVEHRCEPGLVHGFVQWLDLESPAAAAASERFFASAGRLMHGRGA